MNAERHQDERHPDAAALAEYRAGLAGGVRGRRLAAHVASCAHCASVSDQLAAVSSTLASAPAPALPDAVERRITAALAAEAALRAETAGTPETARTEAAPAAEPAAAAATAAAATGAVPAGAVPAGAVPAEGPPAAQSPHRTVRRHLPGPKPSQRTRGTTGPRQARAGASGPPRRARGIRGGRRFRPAVLVSSAAAACVVVVFGALFLVGAVRFPAGPPSSSAASGSASSPLSGGAASLPAAGNGPLGSRAGSALEPVFAITASGTRYEPATLAAQVRDQLAAKSSGHTSPAPGSARLASPGTSGAVPPATLAACVLHLTGRARPSLVDWATYAGKPAYVIAVPHHAWVVGPDCTTSDPHLIASIGL
jgi:hypothetical protein